MKKLIAMLLVLILALTLGACGQKAEESAQTPAAEESSQAAASGEDERPEGEHPAKNTGALSLLNMTTENGNVKKIDRPFRNESIELF